MGFKDWERGITYSLLWKIPSQVTLYIAFNGGQLENLSQDSRCSRLSHVKCGEDFEVGEARREVSGQPRL